MYGVWIDVIGLEKGTTIDLLPFPVISLKY